MVPLAVKILQTQRLWYKPQVSLRSDKCQKFSRKLKEKKKEQTLDFSGVLKLPEHNSDAVILVKYFIRFLKSTLYKINNR